MTQDVLRVRAFLDKDMGLSEETLTALQMERLDDRKRLKR